MRAQLLFLFIFFVSFTTQNQILLEKIESSKYENNFRLLKVDDMGNKYYLDNNKFLKKNNLSFSDLSMGLISKADLYNPLKIKIWYLDFNTLVILDNFLNEITRVNFNETSTFNEINNISSANENTVWVYDELDMTIKKFDFFKKIFVEQVETKIDGSFIELISNYNYLWVLTDKFFYKINYNGTIIYKSENKESYDKIRLFKNDVILANYSELIHFENEKELFVNIKHEKLFIKDFFVINETLYIYEKDQLNKFLILSY